MNIKYLLFGPIILTALQTGAQTLWNTNQKWARSAGLQTAQIQAISFPEKGSAIKSRLAAVGEDTAQEEEEQAWFVADTFARNNPERVTRFVRFFSTADTAVSTKYLDLQSTDPEKKNISYIVLALQDSGDILQYFETLKPLDFAVEDSFRIRVFMADIKSMVFKQTPTGKGKFALFLNGDFLTTLQNNSGSSNANGSIASGSIGANYTSPDLRYSITSRITLVSTQDTVTNNYGTQVLVPSKGKGFGTMVLGYSQRIGHKPDTVHPWAWNAFATYSTQHWRLDSVPVSGTPAAVDTFTLAASLIGLDLTLSKSWICSDSISIGTPKYPLSFNVNLGLAERFLGGDVQKPLQTDNSLLKQTGYYAHEFPTKRSMFFGLETGGSISLGPVMAEFEVFYFFPNTSKDIQPLYGLTGLQFSFGASVNLNFYHN